MKLYIAGSSTELDRVSDFIAKVRAGGDHVTSDWPDTIAHRAATEGLFANDGLPEHIRVQESAAAKAAVQRADGLVILIPENPKDTIGAWFEAGVANGSGIPFWTVGGKRDASIFTALALRHFETDAEALEYFQTSPA